MKIVWNGHKILRYKASALPPVGLPPGPIDPPEGSPSNPPSNKPKPPGKIFCDAHGTDCCCGTTPPPVCYTGYAACNDGCTEAGQDGYLVGCPTPPHPPYLKLGGRCFHQNGTTTGTPPANSIDLAGATSVSGCNACCTSPTCPTNCSNCPSTIFATIPGYTISGGGGAECVQGDTIPISKPLGCSTCCTWTGCHSKPNGYLFCIGPDCSSSSLCADPEHSDHICSIDCVFGRWRMAVYYKALCPSGADSLLGVYDGPAGTTCPSGNYVIRPNTGQANNGAPSAIGVG